MLTIGSSDSRLVTATPKLAIIPLELKPISGFAERRTGGFRLKTCLPCPDIIAGKAAAGKHRDAV